MISGWGEVVTMATQDVYAKFYRVAIHIILTRQIASRTYSIYFVAQLVRIASMHSFLIYRYFTLSRNLAATISLSIPALSAIVTGCFVPWALNRYTTISQRGQLDTVITYALSKLCLRLL